MRTDTIWSPLGNRDWAICLAQQLDEAQECLADFAAGRILIACRGFMQRERRFEPGGSVGTAEARVSFGFRLHGYPAGISAGSPRTSLRLPDR